MLWTLRKFTHTHRPVRPLWLPPPSGTQTGSNQDNTENVPTKEHTCAKEALKTRLSSNQRSCTETKVRHQRGRIRRTNRKSGLSDSLLPARCPSVAQTHNNTAVQGGPLHRRQMQWKNPWCSLSSSVSRWINPVLMVSRHFLFASWIRVKILLLRDYGVSNTWDRELSSSFKLTSENAATWRAGRCLFILVNFNVYF